MSKSILGFGFGVETTNRPNMFGSFGYFFNPGKKGIYYLGLQFDIMNSQKDGDGKHVSSENDLGMHNNVSMTTLNFSQKFFFKPSGKVNPYLNASVGLRYMHQEVYNVYRTTIPILGWPVKAQDSLYEKEVKKLAITFGGGLYFQPIDLIGFDVGLDYRIWTPFEMYQDEQRASNFLSLHFGMAIGLKRKGARYHNKKRITGN